MVQQKQTELDDVPVQCRGLSQLSSGLSERRPEKSFASFRIWTFESTQGSIRWL